MYSGLKTNFSSTNFTWIELGILVEKPADNCLESPQVTILASTVEVSVKLPTRHGAVFTGTLILLL
jgi:hypothetical protein